MAPEGFEYRTRNILFVHNVAFYWHINEQYPSSTTIIPH